MKSRQLLGYNFFREILGYFDFGSANNVQWPASEFPIFPRLSVLFLSGERKKKKEKKRKEKKRKEKKRKEKQGKVCLCMSKVK